MALGTTVTLINYARQDNPEGVAEWEKTYANELVYYTSKAKFGEMTVKELKVKWCQRGINTKCKTDMALIAADIMRCIALIIDGSTKYITNNQNGFSIIDRSKYEGDLKSTYIHDLSYKYDAKDKKSKKDGGLIPLYSFVQRITRTLASRMLYDGIQYTIGEDVDPGYINMFKGYKAPIKDSYDIAHVNVVRKHIKEVFANGNEEHASYIEQWLAHMCFNPQKIGVALFIIGSMGCGKSMFFDNIIKHIIGQENGYATDTLDTITAKFNGVLGNKRFILANEVKGCGTREYQKLKSLVTDDLISVELKGVDVVQAKSSHYFVFLSNYAEQFFIEDHDRRFAVFECGPKRDAKYYTALAHAMSTGASDIITWLKEVYIPDFNLREIPVSSLKKQMMDDNKHPVLKFLDTWADGECDSHDVYEGYVQWCDYEGYKPVPKNRMIRVSQGRITSSGRKVINGIKRTMWLLK